MDHLIKRLLVLKDPLIKFTKSIKPMVPNEAPPPSKSDVHESADAPL